MLQLIAQGVDDCGRTLELLLQVVSAVDDGYLHAIEYLSHRLFLDIQQYLAVSLVILHDFFLLMRHLCQASDWLLQYGSRVASTLSEIHEKSWNVLKNAITLHQKSEMISIFDLLIQREFKGLILSTLSAYYISRCPD